MTARGDRVIARLRDGARREIEIELRSERRAERPMVRLERFVAALTTAAR